MGATLRTEAGGIQGLPLAAGAQHEQDGVQGVAVVHARVVATERVGLSWRDQRLHLGPECVGNAPAIIIDDQSHGSASFLGVSTPLEYPSWLVLTPYWDRL
jgi:hypothetical protein